MASCTATVPDKNLSGDNLYGPRICWQAFIDWAWDAHDFDEGDFDPKVLSRNYLCDPQPSHAFVYVCTIQRMAINLFGPLNVSHVVLRGMATRGFGRVVNIASDAGRVGSSGEAVYSACKGGIIAFTKTVARELVDKGIIVNTLCPGPTDTAILRSFLEGPDGTRIAAALERTIPMRRLGVPEDYPGLVAFLLSDDAAYMTGQTISVSGGLTMHG